MMSLHREYNALDKKKVNIFLISFRCYATNSHFILFSLDSWCDLTIYIPLCSFSFKHELHHFSHTK